MLSAASISVCLRYTFATCEQGLRISACAPVHLCRKWGEEEGGGGSRVRLFEKSLKKIWPFLFDARVLETPIKQYKEQLSKAVNFVREAIGTCSSVSAVGRSDVPSSA